MDGVEKAADTLPVGVKPGAPDGFGGGCGIAVRDGGVSGAPNMAPPAAAGFASDGTALGPASFGFSAGAAEADESFTTDGVNLGENGGVR